MSGWIKRKDCLPKGERGCPFVPVLFALRVGTRPVCAGRYMKRSRQWVSLQGVAFTNAEVTHWMPLPEPPQATPQKSMRGNKT